MVTYTQNYSISQKPKYHTTTTLSKKNKKVGYQCSDDDYIEVPGGTDSVIYTDDEGQSYEVDIDNLIDYDGDDGEIQYTKGKKKNIPVMFLTPQMIAMNQHKRIYS